MAEALDLEDEVQQVPGAPAVVLLVNDGCKKRRSRCSERRAESPAEDEVLRVAAWLTARLADQTAAHEIGVFVRSAAQLPRARRAADKAGLPYKVLDDHLLVPSGYASLGTMHLAKGLEFKAVAVMACDDEVLPSQERIENVREGGDLQEVYDSERQLLYVASTRARDVLVVSGVAPVSEFIEDMREDESA